MALPERKIPEGAPFNSAIDTLMRIGDIFRRIVDNDANNNISDELKQKNKIALVQNLHTNASALLPKETVKKYQERVDNLEPKELQIMDKQDGSIKNKTKLIYDKKLNTTLNNLIVDISGEMRDEGLFMPPKNDPKFSWKQ